MSKAAFIILAAGDTHESLGRVVNAFMGALEYIESGSEVPIIFDGAGTQAAAEFAAPDPQFLAKPEVRSARTVLAVDVGRWLDTAAYNNRAQPALPIEGASRLNGRPQSAVPTGDVRRDMDVIRAFYREIRGKNPDLQSEPRLEEEDGPSERGAQ